MAGAPEEFEDRFFAAAYGLTLDAIEIGERSQTRELIVGRPETTVRLWEMPFTKMRVGCLESLYEVLAEVKASNSVDGIGKRIREIVRDWEPVWTQLQEQPTQEIHFGRDGQGIEMPGGFDFMDRGFPAL